MLLDSKSCTLQDKSTQEILHGFAGCITPSRVIILRNNLYMPCPIILIDRMHPGTPHKQLETPGMKCKSREGRKFACILQKYNHLMVVVERNWRSKGKDETILISFWDLRDEPCLFKEHNLIDILPSAVVSEYELGDGCRGSIYGIDIKLNSEILVVFLGISNIHPENLRFQCITLLYRVNTTEPAQDTDDLPFLRIVKINLHAWFSCPRIYLNEKYLIFPTIINDEPPVLEVRELQTLLSAVDTRLAPRKVLPLLSGKYVLEPGMSDRLAVFDTWTNCLTILDLVSTNPTTIVDTIQWSILGQPSEKYDPSDKKLKFKNIDGVWCCGSFLILQRLELPLTRKKHRQWTFKLTIVDSGTVVKRPEVISQIKDIFDPNISYPKEVGDEECYIDVMGIVHVVTDTSSDVTYLIVNCAQFHCKNAAQAECIGALEDSSSDQRGAEEDGKVEEETGGKEKGNAFYSGINLKFSHIVPRQYMHGVVNNLIEISNK